MARQTIYKVQESANKVLIGIKQRDGDSFVTGEIGVWVGEWSGRAMLYTKDSPLGKEFDDFSCLLRYLKDEEYPTKIIDAVKDIYN